VAVAPCTATKTFPNKKGKLTFEISNGSNINFKGGVTAKQAKLHMGWQF
jgi:hypothetical protein